ncbi:MAG: 4-hydroxy-3-methylbut-2-enyl diphosphate reductase [bacterium]
MKRIEIGRYAGFCSGVERTVKVTRDALKKDGDSVYSLGQIIHSPQMVRRLERLGLKVINDICEVLSGTFIVRSHGLPDRLVEEVERRGINVIDATCPFVKKVREQAKLLIDKGYKLIIIGDKNHPEIKGVMDAVFEKAVVVSSFNELDDVKIGKKVGVVFQTTFPLSWAQNIISALFERCQELLIHNTLCFETLIRQREALEIASVVDVMIVVGGRNSANTTHLSEIVRATGCSTYHIEEPDELKEEWFDGVEKVGLTAGASTPSWLINDVIKGIKKILDDVEVHTFGG